MSEENKALARRLIEEVQNEGNVDALDELAAPEVFEHTAAPEHQRGIEGLKQVVGWSRAAFPDQRWDIEDIIAEGDKVGVRLTWSGTHEGEFLGFPPTGKRFSVEHAHWFRFADGKLVERWTVRDDLGMARQLGFIPPLGGSEKAAVSDPEEVLSYWFPPGIHEADVETYRAQMLRWFQGGPEVDMEITERFAPVLEQARRGELDHWADTPRGRLALIIVLDQFSRSVYRGTPLAYAQDPAALRLAQEGIEAGMDRGLELAERLFFVLPLGHTEDSALPKRAEWLVRYAEEQVNLAPPHLKPIYEFSLGQAMGHRDVIARFGRHPHRNEVLGRVSTPEELEYLDNEAPVHTRRPPREASDA